MPKMNALLYSKVPEAEFDWCISIYILENQFESWQLLYSDSLQQQV